MAEPRPKGIMNAKEPEFRQMDNTDASSFGFGSSPESSTRSSNDHHSKLQNMQISAKFDMRQRNLPELRVTSTIVFLE
jgi:hypothetical protein